MMGAPLLREAIQKAFPGVLEPEADEMVETGKVRSYAPKTILCHENAIEDVFYIMLEGEVEVSKLFDESGVRILKHLVPGDFFGEMALIHDAPRAATVKTVLPTTVLEINKEAFDDLLQRNTSVSLAMVREVSRRLRENDEMAIIDLRVKAQELADAYQQLAELDFARREFLTTVAHELRTPLTSVSGFVQLIRMGLVEGEAFNTALETVYRNVQDIISLVNNILFLQEMELIFPEFQPLDIGSLVAGAVEQQRTHARRNQVGVNLNIAPRMPAVPGDAKSLERALVAILDNAIKFSPDGGEILVDVVGEDRQVKVIVRDKGVGIPEDALPHIFDRFYHLDKVGGHLFRGIGLGLSIARQVIEQHGGKILVDSELGKGSTFTVTLTVEESN